MVNGSDSQEVVEVTGYLLNEKNRQFFEIA